MSSFYKRQSYFSQIVSKKANITISFFMKNSKNNNIILDFSFMYLVSVHPTNRTQVTKICNEPGIKFELKKGSKKKSEKKKLRDNLTNFLHEP